MRAKSIRWRLTLWYTIISTSGVLLLGVSAYQLLSYSLSHEVDAALNGVATAMVERARGGKTPPTLSDIDDLFRRFFGFSPWDRYFQMFDPRGRRELPQQPGRSTGFPLSREALENAARGVSTFETVNGFGEYPVRLLTAPVMEGGRVVNLIQVGLSLQNSIETRFRFLLIMAALLPLSLILAGSGGWLFSKRAFRPIDQMVEAARRIGAGNLAERIEETGAGDELDRLAQTLNRMFKRLDASFTQVRRFSADASHELQTPLTILKGELEVALRSPRTQEEYESTLKSILEEVDRIAHLVDSLLLLQRAEVGALRMDRQPVDLARVVEEVFWRIKVVADVQGKDLRMEISEPATVPGDLERIRRLLLNLADNAVKYTHPEGRVTLALGREGGFAAIEVSDTGIGIPESELERIFQPFYRSPDARALSERGTGLGLSIARSIAGGHGGRIEVSSVPGRGSTFKVLFPLDLPDES